MCACWGHRRCDRSFSRSDYHPQCASASGDERWEPGAARLFALTQLKIKSSPGAALAEGVTAGIAQHSEGAERIAHALLPLCLNITSSAAAFWCLPLMRIGSFLNLTCITVDQQLLLLSPANMNYQYDHYNNNAGNAPAGHPIAPMYPFAMVPPVFMPEDTTCSYPSKRCDNPRVVKRNGDLHKLCEFHRSKANRNQRRLELKRKSKGQGGETAGDATKADANPKATTAERKKGAMLEPLNSECLRLPEAGGEEPLLPVDMDEQDIQALKSILFSDDDMEYEGSDFDIDMDMDLSGSDEDELLPSPSLVHF